MNVTAHTAAEAAAAFEARSSWCKERAQEISYKHKISTSNMEHLQTAVESDHAKGQIARMDLGDPLQCANSILRAHCDEETSSATEGRADRESDVAKTLHKLESAVAGSVAPDGDDAVLQSEFGALSKSHMEMDTRRATSPSTSYHVQVPPSSVHPVRAWVHLVATRMGQLGRT